MRNVRQKKRRRRKKKSYESVGNKMSQIIIGETTTGMISLIPSVTEEDIKKYHEHQNQENKPKKTKKIRRTFSMPRNPFRMSIKRNDENTTDTNASTITTTTPPKTPTNTNTTIIHDEDDSNKIGSTKRLFRRSSLRKFITRIAQQMTSVNIGVSYH